jgi:hypothetical protein
MQIDSQRWQRLCEQAANAEHDGPDFVTIQAANGRAAQARDQLARFRAAGPQGRASGPPMARSHAGEKILAGVGGHGPDDVVRAFERDVREMEARETAAKQEAQRLADRLHQCAQRRNDLQPASSRSTAALMPASRSGSRALRAAGRAR